MMVALYSIYIFHEIWCLLFLDFYIQKEPKFGTRKGLSKENLNNKFGRNPMNIHRVMTDYLRKIRSKVCHAHRVNRLKE